MQTNIWKGLRVAGAALFVVALVNPAFAARQISDTQVVVKKANKALVASP